MYWFLEDIVLSLLLLLCVVVIVVVAAAAALTTCSTLIQWIVILQCEHSIRLEGEWGGVGEGGVFVEGSL